jgi:hypothetical protein
MKIGKARAKEELKGLPENSELRRLWQKLQVCRISILCFSNVLYSMLGMNHKRYTHHLRTISMVVHFLALNQAHQITHSQELTRNFNMAEREKTSMGMILIETSIMNPELYCHLEKIKWTSPTS